MAEESMIPANRDFMMANAEHFIEGRGSLKCFIDTVFQQGSHAEKACLTTDRLRSLALEGHFPDSGIQLHHFKDAKPATIARMMAIIAAPAPHEVSSR